MSTWDEHIFTSDDNVEFLDDLIALDEDDIIEAIHDAIMLATGNNQATEEEEQNALAAAHSHGNRRHSYPWRGRYKHQRRRVLSLPGLWLAPLGRGRGSTIPGGGGRYRHRLARLWTRSCCTGSFSPHLLLS